MKEILNNTIVIQRLVSIIETFPLFLNLISPYFIMDNVRKRGESIGAIRSSYTEKGTANFRRFARKGYDT